MQLPLIKSITGDLSLLTTKWKSILDPLLRNPLNGVSILKDIVVIAGNNQIPHLLGRKPQGFFIVNANVVTVLNTYQPFDESFLYLASLSAGTVSIGVF